MRFKPLTKEQQETFKELYLAGYSGSLIYEKLGYPYNTNCTQRYSALMRSYRIKLGLPRRVNSQEQVMKPKFYRFPQPKITTEQRKQERIQKLENMIPRQERKLNAWKTELTKLCSSFDSKTTEQK